jgi:hypothetical protein
MLASLLRRGLRPVSHSGSAAMAVGMRHVMTARPSNTSESVQRPGFWRSIITARRQRREARNAMAPEYLKWRCRPSWFSSIPTETATTDEGLGRTAVLRAIIGDAGLAAMKAGVWLISGSSAVLAEAVHTLVDTANQCVLLVGLKESSKAPSDKV